MIFRFEGYRKIPMDFKNSYSGSCFIVGGSPSLLDEKFELMEKQGVVCIGMNSVSASFPRIIDISVNADFPSCYDKLCLLDSKIQHFSLISRAYEEIKLENGKTIQWKDVPNTYFYPASSEVPIYDFLSTCDKHFVWWKNIFPIAIQLAYYLGFRKVYLAGCSFKVNKIKPYSYDMKLNENQVKWNNIVYGQAAEWMKNLKVVFENHDFEVVSCTKDSSLNDFYPYVSVEKAVSEILSHVPAQNDFSKVNHSSDYIEKGK